jgi:hypothetical protein
MHWNKELAYFISPKSGPMRGMVKLIDANHALSQDLPQGFLKRSHWTDAAYRVVQAAETGRDRDVQAATDEMLRAIEQEGWMNRKRVVNG